MKKQFQLGEKICMDPYLDRVQLNSKILDIVLPDKDGSCTSEPEKMAGNAELISGSSYEIRTYKFRTFLFRTLFCPLRRLV